MGKRVLYLHQYFNLPYEVGSTRSYELSRRWAARNFEITIISGVKSPHPRGRKSVSSGVQVIRMGLKYSQLYGTFRRLLSWIGYLLSATVYVLINGKKYDAIYASSTPLTAILPAIFCQRIYQIPFVFEVRDLWPDVPVALGRLSSRSLQSLAFSIAKMGYSRAGSIVALSPDMAREIRTRYSVPERKVLVAPNGAYASSDSDAKNSPRHNGRFRIIYAGTLGPVNSPLYIVELAATLAQQRTDVEFDVYGDGSQLALAIEAARSQGVLDRVLRFHAPRPKPEVLEMLAAADLSLSTTADVQELWANSANKVFESFGVGTPVALNHRGWLAELVERRDLGIVLDSRNLSVAALQLSAYIDAHPDVRLRQSRNCHSIARHELGWDQASKTTMSAIERLW